MPSVDLFAEDQAHELFVSALLRCILGRADLHVRSAVGGHERALTELKTYQRLVLRGAAGLVRPDLLIVIIDANCQEPVKAKNAIQREIVTEAAGETVIACPDPHIERWFFADPEVFTRIIGVDQQPGRRKCERSWYNALLKEAVRRAGHFPTMGGVEFAEELVWEMDLHRAGRNEPSLGTLIDGVSAFATRAQR